MRHYDRALPLRTHSHSLTEIMEITARIAPDQVALIYDDEPVDFAELLERMKRVAAYLRNQGIQPNDRVALQVDNRPEFAYVAGGILMAGGVMVAMNVMYLEAEIRHILQNSGATIVFAIDSLADRILNIRRDLPSLKDVVVIGSPKECCATFDSVLEYQPLDQIICREGNDLALLQYTSGTTGRPKGAM